MFVVPVALAPAIHASCTRAIALRERVRLVQVIEQGGIAGDGEAWLRRVEEATVQALRARGEAVATELSADVPELRLQVLLGQGTRWEALQTLTTRVLFVLAASERIVRGRPRGSWTSSQYRWAPMDAWLPGGMPEVPAEAGRAELVRRWLWTFGPATAADIRWWTGWTVRHVAQALQQVGTAEVALDGGTGLVLDGDLDSPAAPEPSVALLPALDPTVMGWPERRWFLGEHGPALFDRSGNAGPTVWWDGRIVGGWAQRRDGEVVFRLLEDAGADAARAVEAAAERLSEWLGPVRVTPRFRTPLERELSA
jgi:hypothetical protein